MPANPGFLSASTASGAKKIIDANTEERKGNCTISATKEGVRTRPAGTTPRPCRGAEECGDSGARCCCCMRCEAGSAKPRPPLPLLRSNGRRRGTPRAGRLEVLLRDVGDTRRQASHLYPSCHVSASCLDNSEVAEGLALQDAVSAMWNVAVTNCLLPCSACWCDALIQQMQRKAISQPKGPVQEPSQAAHRLDVRHPLRAGQALRDGPWRRCRRV